MLIMDDDRKHAFWLRRVEAIFCDAATLCEEGGGVRRQQGVAGMCDGGS
jgi:hypothetical protein